MKKRLSISIGSLLASSIPGVLMGQYLFVSDWSSDNIYEYTPGGARSTLAFVPAALESLAFNSTGDLFVANEIAGAINKITPGGAQSTFASGLNSPGGLAFDGAGNLFEGDLGSGNLYKIYAGRSAKHLCLRVECSLRTCL